MVSVLHRERRVPLPGTKEKRRTESVMDEKLALLLWSEFSIGNREFHYQVWKEKKGNRVFYYPRYEREEKEQSL